MLALVLVLSHARTSSKTTRLQKFLVCVLVTPKKVTSSLAGRSCSTCPAP